MSSKAPNHPPRIANRTYMPNDAIRPPPPLPPPNPPNLKNECEFPNDNDLDYMEKAVQRHVGGFDAWWEQNRDKFTGREWMQIFITIWEAGRKGK